MYSGKTSELVRRIKRYKIGKHRCYVVNYRGDTRYTSTGTVTTHDENSLVTDVTCKRLSEIKEEDLKDVEVIGIDEGQFLPDIVEFCETQTSLGRICIVSALKATFQGEPWPSIARLIAKADTILALTAVCVICGFDGASHTRRISSDVGIEVVGGTDKYIATCRKCFTVPLDPLPSSSSSSLS